MNKLLLGAIAATVSFAAAPSAHAAQYLTITGPSGTFGDDNVTCANNGVTCSFDRTFTFTTPTGFNLASADISSILTGNNFATNIDFSTVTFNGVNFNTILTGTQEFRNLLNQSIVAGGTNTLFVAGIVGAPNSTTPANASFTGNLSFASVNSAVPEPATWAMMMLGFGGMGFAMRRRNRTSARIRFA